ncbi:MAG: FRG domain-containing protein [Myxococcales bacterium]|nr:MAG: FRG domain-containing protein [Myxococcales bacterium]
MCSSGTEELIEIRSVTNLLSLSSKPATRYYFRGLPCANYELIPKLLREEFLGPLSKLYCESEPVKLQALLLQRFVRYASSYYRDGTLGTLRDNFSEWLCVAQHNGLPTLLLDWTLNPLVGLYFAVSKCDDKDGCVWCMELKNPSDRQLTTVHLEEKKELREDYSAPCLVIPRPFNRRIEAQAGRFTYSTCRDALDKICSKDPYADKRVPWRRMIKWVVPANEANKKKILEELGLCQIHDGTVFADLDGFARYLAGGGL